MIEREKRIWKRKRKKTHKYCCKSKQKQEKRNKNSTKQTRANECKNTHLHLQLHGVESGVREILLHHQAVALAKVRIVHLSASGAVAGWVYVKRKEHKRRKNMWLRIGLRNCLDTRKNTSNTWSRIYFLHLGSKWITVNTFTVFTYSLWLGGSSLAHLTDSFEHTRIIPWLWGARKSMKIEMTIHKLATDWRLLLGM